MTEARYPFQFDAPPAEAASAAKPGIFEAEIDALCARLQALKAPRADRKFPSHILKPDAYNGLLQDTVIDDECPETLERMRDLVLDAAGAMDLFFKNAAEAACVGKPGEYDRAATNSIDGFLEWDLQHKADDIRDSQPSEPWWPHGHFGQHRG